jgi:hypothetical protein
MYSVMGFIALVMFLLSNKKDTDKFERFILVGSAIFTMVGLLSQIYCINYQTDGTPNSISK